MDSWRRLFFSPARQLSNYHHPIILSRSSADWPEASHRQSDLDSVQNYVYLAMAWNREIVMSTTTLPVSEAKQRFTDLVRTTEESFDRYVITRNGKEAALLMSAEEYAGLLETLDILSNRKEVKALARGIADARRNRTTPLEKYLARKPRPPGRKSS